MAATFGAQAPGHTEPGLQAGWQSFSGVVEHSQDAKRNAKMTRMEIEKAPRASNRRKRALEIADQSKVQQLASIDRLDDQILIEIIKSRAGEVGDPVDLDTL
jgi:hypothetical protein